MASVRLSRPAWSWTLYDWASSAFATTVMAGFFPVFFKEYWNAGADVTVNTLRLGTASSAASLSVAFLAPVLGAIADGSAARRVFLLWFAGLGILATASLVWVPGGAWLAAAVVYGLAIIGFSGANVFYDSLLLSVVRPDRSDFVSALGFAVGYLGGGVLLAINVAMTMWPSALGCPEFRTRCGFLSSPSRPGGRRSRCRWHCTYARVRPRRRAPARPRGSAKGCAS
jgi:UMF1 family MFS transporter